MPRLSTAGRRWLVGGAALVGVALTTTLGAWQWGRAQQKLALQAAIEASATLPVLDAAALTSATNAQSQLHRPVRLRGQWQARHTVFLDNRQMLGRPGFYVLTPLQLEVGGVVLVQRGWVPRDFIDRTRLPTLATPQEMVEIRGRIAPPPAKLYEPGTAAPGPIRQNLDLSAFRAVSGLPLRTDLSVQQTGEPTDGLRRDWPVAASTASKNYGYAFQWWALAGVILFFYVWLQFILPRRRARSAPG